MILVYPFENAFEHLSFEEFEIFSFPRQYAEKRADNKLIPFFKKLLQNTSPDIVHIHGTEFYQSVAMAKAAEEMQSLNRCVVSIQGLVSLISHFYYGLVPNYVVYRFGICDFLRRCNLHMIKNRYEKRGEAEVECLKIIKNVLGRTDWDKAAIKIINPNIKYYHCNETLRKSFYINSWKYEDCEKHSIFVSQSSNPIKGFHHALEALFIVKKFYPDATLYVTGNDVREMGIFQLDSYHKYLKHLIEKYDLSDSVFFLGNLNEKEMVCRFLKSNCFIMPSSIENSPNSLGEAMILGVPSVCADVGGVKSLFEHNKDGFIYSYGHNYMLADRIMDVFDHLDNREYSENSKKHASRTHDVDENFKALMKAYDDVLLQL